MITELVSVAKYEVETVLALLASGHQDVMQFEVHLQVLGVELTIRMLT